MPEWVIPLLVQLPLVAVVAAYFRSEQKRAQREYEAELKRRTEAITGQITDWRALYNQERTDRIEADKRLAVAVSEIKDGTARIEELTKEVIRASRP